MRPPRTSCRSGLLWIRASSELPKFAPSEARSPSRPLAICDLGRMLHEFNCATPTAGAAYRPGAAIFGKTVKRSHLRLPETLLCSRAGSLQLGSLRPKANVATEA